MGLLGRLVEDATGHDVPIADLLRRLRVVASRSGLDELAAWVGYERDGYPDDATLPTYRGPFRGAPVGTFSGPFGSSIRDFPLPSSAFPEAWRETYLFNILFTQPVAELQALAKSGGAPRLPWPADVVGTVNAALDRRRRPRQARRCSRLGQDRQHQRRRAGHLGLPARQRGRRQGLRELDRPQGRGPDVQVTGPAHPRARGPA